MNITTNAIGNYSAVRMSPSIKQSQPSIKTDKVSKESAVSETEKKFFAGLYPENKSEIADYHFYNKSGTLLGVSKGSLFDKRG